MKTVFKRSHFSFYEVKFGIHINECCLTFSVLNFLPIPISWYNLISLNFLRCWLRIWSYNSQIQACGSNMETTKYKVMWMLAKKSSVYVFKVGGYEFSVRFYKFKMADPIWLPCCHKISVKLLKQSLWIYISWYNLVSQVFWVADYKSEVRKSKLKMADPMWLPCSYKVSINLTVVRGI